MLLIISGVVEGKYSLPTLFYFAWQLTHRAEKSIVSLGSEFIDWGSEFTFLFFYHYITAHHVSVVQSTGFILCCFYALLSSNSKQNRLGDLVVIGLELPLLCCCQNNWALITPQRIICCSYNFSLCCWFICSCFFFFAWGWIFCWLEQSKESLQCHNLLV